MNHNYKSQNINLINDFYIRDQSFALILYGDFYGNGLFLWDGDVKGAYSNILLLSIRFLSMVIL